MSLTDGRWGDDEWKRVWKRFTGRSWADLKGVWIGAVPTTIEIGSKPDPGLDDLSALIDLTPSDWLNARCQNTSGLRPNALLEALYLFQKCSHTSLAAQRLASVGMNSWCLFNAYHSAYLGAKGILALLGVAFPVLNGTQVAVDLFPEPEKKQSRNDLKENGRRFDDFLIMRFPKLDQRRMWQALHRLLRVCDVGCWDGTMVSEILGVRYDEVTPPRNHFLYKVTYWPLNDLMADEVGVDLGSMVRQSLDVATDGFLLRLSLLVHRLLERMVNDLAASSPVIKVQLDASRFGATGDSPELDLYRSVVLQ
ncbi:MAG TPA: hypothetical protein VG273_23365 [Bryobacteraceae bacterium]|jgi:hypothetical protein|nr:hypothetical protein [Bryobacteraceae bacterium]